MQAFFVSLAIVFLAELGDKTQLVALCLASRFKARVVLSGIFVATLVVHVVSVALGGGLGKILPEAWVKLAAGIAFIGFGLWTLRGDCLSEEECNNLQGRSPFWLVTTTFFIAELGDKTMLSTVALATTHSVIPVWLGSTLGMVISDGLAIAAGQILGARLPERTIRTGAAIIFFAFGAFSAVGGAIHLPPHAWVSGGSAIGVVVVFFLRAQQRDKLILQQKTCAFSFLSGSFFFHEEMRKKEKARKERDSSGDIL